MYNSLLTSLEEGILTVTINRPDKLNALNKEVMEELDQVAAEMESNAEVKAVIITGAGSKAFVAGADISEFMGLSGEEGAALAKKGQDIFFRFENAAKPVVAAVNGFALGGGCELAMACHFRIASTNARFGQPEVNLGLIPGYGGTQRLVQLIGKGRAMEALMSGNMIDAAKAEQYGLVNRVVAPEELIAQTKAVLQTIITKAPLAVSKCIVAANSAYLGKEGYAAEVKGFGECFVTDDMKEGTTAFIEKRKPSFSGK